MEAINSSRRNQILNWYCNPSCCWQMFVCVGNCADCCIELPLRAFEIHSVDIIWNLDFRLFSYSATNKMHLFLKLFILVKGSTCFGRSFRPSSRAQTAHTATGTCAVSSSWLWTERPSETCSAFYKNK